MVNENVTVRHRKPGAESIENITAQPPLEKHLYVWKYFCLKIIFVISTSIVGLCISIDLYNSDLVDPNAIFLPTPPNLDGPLTPNAILPHGEKMFKNQLIGPESIVFDNGHIYTGTADGQILHIHNDTVQVLTTLGKPPCGGHENEFTCGRPLGLRLHKGVLYAMDAYLGIFKINIHTGYHEQLYSSKDPINGIHPKLLDDLDISSDGIIYFTDASSEWYVQDSAYDVFSLKGNGRLMALDPNSGTIDVLLEGLHFANGVQLSNDESYVLVVETGLFRVLKVNLNGSGEYKPEVFAENLPGFPDNIRKSSRGGFWIALFLTRHSGKTNILDFLAPHPWIRKILCKYFPLNIMTKYKTDPHGLIIELDEKGDIVRSMHDPSGEMASSITQVTDDLGVLYLGSLDAPYIVKVDTNN